MNPSDNAFPMIGINWTFYMSSQLDSDNNLTNGGDQPAEERGASTLTDPAIPLHHVPFQLHLTSSSSSALCFPSRRPLPLLTDPSQSSSAVQRSFLPSSRTTEREWLHAIRSTAVQPIPYLSAVQPSSTEPICSIFTVPATTPTTPSSSTQGYASSGKDRSGRRRLGPDRAVSVRRRLCACLPHELGEAHLPTYQGGDEGEVGGERVYRALSEKDSF